MLQRCAWRFVFCLAAGIGLAADKSAHQPKTYDWPQWQGPRRDALCQETGLLKAWPAEGPPLVWKARKLGGGFSTPSVAAGRIFGMGSRDRDEVVWALDEATGKELWSTQVNPSLPKVGHGEGPRCTPTVDGDRLYALGVGGDLVCLDVVTGKQLWRKNHAKDFGGRMMSGWGFSESPLVDGDQLICTPGGDKAALVALNKTNGEVIWKAAIPNAGGAGYASVVVAELGPLRQYVQLLGKGIVGVAAKDGRFLWRYDKIANRTANIPTPIIHGDLVFCSTGYNTGSALLRLVPSGNGQTEKAEEIYFLPGKDLQNHHGGLVLVGDHIYCGHGHNAGAPSCVELKTGKLAWRKDRGPGTGSAAVLYADGMLYFRYQDGVMALIEATPEAYKQVSTFKLPDNSGKPSWPHPVIANGKLYIRDQDTLLCFDVKQH